MTPLKMTPLKMTPNVLIRLTMFYCIVMDGIIIHMLPLGVMLPLGAHGKLNHRMDRSYTGSKASISYPQASSHPQASSLTGRSHTGHLPKPGTEASGKSTSGRPNSGKSGNKSGGGHAAQLPNTAVGRSSMMYDKGGHGNNHHDSNRMCGLN